MANLESDRLVIRPFSTDDVPAAFRLSQEPSLGEWMPDQVYEDQNEAGEVVGFLISLYTRPLNPQARPMVFAVDLKATGELIGHVGLSPLHGEVEVGYAIAEDHCRKGYATEAVSAVVNWAVSELSIGGVLGVVAVENIGSMRVLEKAGFMLKSEEDLSYLGKTRACRKYYFASTDALKAF